MSVSTGLSKMAGTQNNPIKSLDASTIGKPSQDVNENVDDVIAEYDSGTGSNVKPLGPPENPVGNRLKGIMLLLASTFY